MIMLFQVFCADKARHNNINGFATTQQARKFIYKHPLALVLFLQGRQSEELATVVFFVHVVCCH